MSPPDENLHADPSQRVTIDTARMAWQPSPSPGVRRKRLHRSGPPESGRVTSVVEYAPGSSFPSHPHPEGEEIFVLSGTFSDLNGHATAGTHLLNPEGFEHAPWSEEGCTLFVKLRQYPGTERTQHRTDTTSLPWVDTGAAGVARKALYADARFPDSAYLERWAPGTRRMLEFPQGAEIFLLDGALREAAGRHAAGTWLRFPAGTAIDAGSAGGCEMFVKEGALAFLRDPTGD